LTICRSKPQQSWIHGNCATLIAVVLPQTVLFRQEWNQAGESLLLVQSFSHSLPMSLMDIIAFS
jgi:hypothetical protein